MKATNFKIILTLFFVGLTACNTSVVKDSVAKDDVINKENSDSANTSTLLHSVAERPPLGWNSFDAWDSRINEEDYRRTVEFMAEHLKQHGWEYAVIDYIWWNPDPGGYNTKDNYIRRPGHPNLRLNPDGSLKYPEAVTMDDYGRLLPSVKRFPSSANGAGFKPLADWVHSKGLKFGIHIMRGIHRHAYYENKPILGTDKTARDIVKYEDHAAWLNNMFGVDQGLEGAQEYYNSIFKQYAEWGVDYIKADDMMGSCGKPFFGYYGGEIEMMRKAIDNSGRPMVLSLSCGEAPISRGKHLEKNVNMWRVSADFWDKWSALHRSFELLDKWSPFIGENTWPDADMIPFGRLSLDGRPHGPERISNFTLPEQYTLMTLFSIARSPLMIGAELTSTPWETIETFFKNDDILYVNQHSTNNRQVIRVEDEENGYAVWIAEDTKSNDYFVGIFNLGNKPQNVSFKFHMEDLRGEYNVKDLWSGKSLGVAKEKLKVSLDAHGAGMYRLSKVPGSSNIWVKPNEPLKHNNQ